MLTNFLNAEHGGAGAWSLSFMLSVIVLAGLSIDGSNGIRAKEQLQTAADVAAHAGVVALAKGEDVASVRTAVADAAGWNMPVETYGDVLGDRLKNVKLGVFEDGSFMNGDAGAHDTVFVKLAMNKAQGNPVRAFLLNFIGLDSWDVVASSLATYQQTELCSSNNGIFAHGPVRLTASAKFANDYCIYSKQGADLSGRNVFDPGARVAMPDLSNCLMCDDAHNPGIEEARLELNLQLLNVRSHNTASMESFLGVSSYSQPRVEFFGGVALDEDLSPLGALGYNVGLIDKGDVIQIPAAEFENMDFVPGGLVYAVYCRSPLPSYSAHVPTSPAEGEGAEGDGTGGIKTTLTMQTGSGTGIANVAVVTDCLLDFGATADVQNAVIATQAESYISVTAVPGARIGSSSPSCTGSSRVVVISQGDVLLPAELEVNNADFLVAGDLELSPGPSAPSTNFGTSFYVGGEAEVAAQGNWVACEDDVDSLNASLKVIRQVIPTSYEAATVLH